MLAMLPEPGNNHGTSLSLRTLYSPPGTPDQSLIEDSSMAMVNPVREQIVRRFRPSPMLYQFTYSALVQRQGGDYCFLCKKTRPEVILEIDHIDGKKESWVLDKLSIKCRRCNRSRFLSALARSVNGNERE